MVVSETEGSVLYESTSVAFKTPLRLTYDVELFQARFSANRAHIY